MLSWQDSFLTVGASPEVRPLLVAAEPAWVFARDGERLLWSNPAGGALLGASRFAALWPRRWAPGNPLRRELERLARSLPESGSLARLRLTQDLHSVPLACRCRRLRSGDFRALLVQGTEPSGADGSLEALAAFLADEQTAVEISDAHGAILAAAGQDHAVEGVPAGRSLDFPFSNGVFSLTLRRIGSAAAQASASLPATSNDQPVDDVGLPIAPAPLPDPDPEIDPPGPSADTVAAPPERGPEPAIDNAGLTVPPAAAADEDEPAAGSGRSVSAGRVARELSREPVRFLWQTDASDRFLFVSPGLAQVVGRNADVVGERWEDAAGRLRLDPGSRIVRALADRDTWSGQTAWWPVEGSNVRVPTDLTALPIFGADHSFQGYRGFGVLKPAEALMPKAFESRFGAQDGRPARPAEQVPPYEEAPTTAPALPAASGAANVVPIRADLERSADQTRLTPQEFNAFEEIAAALRQRVEGRQSFDLSGEPEPAPERAGSGSQSSEPARTDEQQPDKEAREAGSLGGVVGQALASLVVSLFPAPNTDAEPRYAEQEETAPDSTSAPDLDSERQAEEPEESAPAQVPEEPEENAPAQMPDTTTGDSPEAELPVAPDADAPAEIEVASAAQEVSTPEPAAVTPQVLPATTARPALADGEAQRRVRELTAILDTATDGVIILDGEGIVESANASAEALFGLEADELRNMEFGELLTPESAQTALDYLSGLKENGVATLLNEGREVAARAGSGSIPLSMTLGRISEGDGGRYCAVLRDITHWKRTETELVAARRAAEEASSQKSEFLARVSHEIRTPLNAIIGFAEVMIEERFGPIENERYREYLRDIRTSGEHVVSLVNDLLDISKIEAGKLDLNFVAVPLNDVVRECIAMMQPQASRGRVVLRCSVSREVPGIVADHRTIRQIVLNILSNAIKFTGPGGQVIASTSLADTGEAILRIRDTGEGMTEEELARALEPFRQIATATLSDRTGTGLGLPLTKALVEANRASLGIRSARGEGTVVTVTFPPTRVLSE